MMVTMVIMIMQSPIFSMQIKFVLPLQIIFRHKIWANVHGWGVSFKLQLPYPDPSFEHWECGKENRNSW